MAKTVDDYIAGLAGWQKDVAEQLRRDILATGGLTETFQWGHPVYSHAGAVCLFRAHKSHLTLAFWRGQEMLALEPRLQPSGSFVMAGIKIEGAGEVSTETVQSLVRAGIALNQEKGDPLAQARA